MPRVIIDTSPETLLGLGPSNSTDAPATITDSANQNSSPGRSKWNPPTPVSPTPISPMSRLRRSLQTAVSPVAATVPFWRRESIDATPQTIPLATIQEGERPIVKFRNAVHKIIQMNRMRNAMLSRHDTVLVTKKVPIFGAKHQKCVIDVVDYGLAHQTHARFGNEGLAPFLSRPYRPAKKHVRWINVSGISGDVVGIMARHFDLHELSVEDIISDKKATPSKVDYYRQHVFIRLLAHIPRNKERPGHVCLNELEDWHVLDSEAGSEIGDKSEQHAVKSLASSGLFAAQLLGDGFKSNRAWAKEVFPDLKKTSQLEFTKRLAVMTPREREVAADKALVAALKRGRRVEVLKKHVYIFLRRDGTVITFHDRILDGVFDPIIQRTKHSKSILRRKSDASLLVHAFIDHVVDEALVLVDQYQEQFLRFEKDVLMNPYKTSVMRDVHIASTDIHMAQATFRPVKTLLFTLRKLDLEKTIALAEDERYVLKNKAAVQGFVSADAKIYLADVEDHADHILRSLANISSISERMVAYGFQVVGNGTNDSAKTFTLMTVCFFPVTILTSYYGMNFKSEVVKRNAESFFWLTATPLLIAIFLFLTWQTRWYKLFWTRKI